MLLGEYQHALDPKGRLILPAAYRDVLDEGLVMTVGMDHCLVVYPLPVWQRVAEGLRRLRTTDRRERMFSRIVTSSAHPETLDRQGRITIPARLRDYAELSKDVAVVGRDEHIELWDAARWEAYRGEAMAEYADTGESFDIGIF